MPILEILICTIDHGINKLEDSLLPPLSSIRYLISWQKTENGEDLGVPPKLASRPDIQIQVLHGSGLSKNRNNALKHATGDILLIADDDIHYQESHLQTILESFDDDPDVDILAFQIEDENGEKLKKYPTSSYNYLSAPKGSYISSCEIAFRKSDKIPLFDERFGLGASYLACGEEEVFLFQAARNKAIIRYLPKVIGWTQRATTGTKFYDDEKVRRSKGAVLYILHGYWGALLRCLKFALRMKSPHQLSFFKDMYDGIEYIRKGK